MITKAKEQTDKLEKNGREPQWLTDSRSKAWKLYDGIPTPTLKDELWRHTDISKIDLSKFVSDDIETRAARNIKEEAAGTTQLDNVRLSQLLNILKSASVVINDPAYLSISLSPEAKDKGVMVMDLANACREKPELVRKHLEGLRSEIFDQDKFFTLNAALFDESVFVYVPPNIKLADPLIFAFELCSADGASFPRLIAVADQGSEFKIVNVMSSSSSCFSAGVIQLAVGPGAKVSYLEVQNFQAETTAITRTINQLSKDAQFSSLTIATGGSTVRSDILTELKGQGSEAKTLGIVLGSDSEHYDFNTIVHHQVPNTTSDINFRVALQDSSSSVYQGTIKVAKEAQRTLAYQSNKNLLLSDHARAASIPKLEILANDVKCSHGATVAAVDKDQVFYLNSRGLDTTQAEQLIVSGFLNQVVESFGWLEVVPWLESLLSKKLLG